MRISINRWFSLPRLGKDVFADLMKAKVKYDTKFGFQLTSSTNVPRVLSILSGALGEDVEIARSCFICDNPIDGESNIPDATICAECQRNSDAYEMYIMKFANLMESA